MCQKNYKKCDKARQEQKLKRTENSKKHAKTRQGVLLFTVFEPYLNFDVTGVSETAWFKREQLHKALDIKYWKVLLEAFFLAHCSAYKTIHFCGGQNEPLNWSYKTFSWKKNNFHSVIGGKVDMKLSVLTPDLLSMDWFHKRIWSSKLLLFQSVFFSVCFTPFLQDLVSFFQGKRLCKIAISFKISVGFRPVHLFLQLEENYWRFILSLVPLFKENFTLFWFF